MKVRLENTNVDPRIYNVTIDFTGYPKDIKYFPYSGRLLIRQDREVQDYFLDNLLKPLRLRRISGWRIKFPETSHYKRINVYYTIVISDRMNKRNDVG